MARTGRLRRVMRWVFNQTDFTPGEKLVAAAIGFYAVEKEAGRGGLPSLAILAKETALSERTVIQTLESIRSKGAIRFEDDTMERLLAEYIGKLWLKAPPTHLDA